MPRLTALLIFVVLWAAIYLPGLGSTELKGEEGRRIMPAVRMLETGNWLVPYLGSEPYLRKPPLINWVIAGSFKLTGVRNEWTARLPSALAVLAMGATMIAVSGSGWMKPETSLIAAIMASTFAGLLAKARFAGAEIEGVYVPLFGIAMTTWLAWRSKGESPWLTWCIPFVFLGLGLLTKPLHLLFFYAIAGAILWRARSMKELLHPAHFAGIALMTVIFFAWFLPYIRAEEASGALKVWKDQFANRVVENKSSWSDYAMNLPRGLSDLLPWVLLAPAIVALRRPTPEDDSKAVSLATAILGVSSLLFVGMLLIPGILPRYVLPLTVPMALGSAMMVARLNGGVLTKWHRVNQVLVTVIIIVAPAAPVAAAVVLSNGESKELIAGFDWRLALPAIGASTIAFVVAGYLWSRRAVMLTPVYLVISSAAVLGVGSLLYGSVAPKFIARKDDLRPLAARIDKSMPPGAELVIFQPVYTPGFASFFYIKSRHRFVGDTREIPSNAEFVLARSKDVDKVRKRRPEYVATFDYERKGEKEFVLLQPLAGRPAN